MDFNLSFIKEAISSVEIISKSLVFFDELILELFVLLGFDLELYCSLSNVNLELNSLGFWVLGDCVGILSIFLEISDNLHSHNMR